AGADPKLRTTANGTVLMAAAGMGHVQGENLVSDLDIRAAVEYALSLNQDPASADAVGNTALHYAAYMRHDSVIPLLVERRAPLESTNRFGEAPLWAAQLVVQFSGGGLFTLIPSNAAAELRRLGAKDTQPTYKRMRPRDWPDIPVTGGGRQPAGKLDPEAEQ